MDDTPFTMKETRHLTISPIKTDDMQNYEIDYI